MQQIVLPLLTIVFAFSCSEKPKIEGFNSDLWKKDKYGCGNKRSYLAEILFEKSTQMKGIDDGDLIDLLGKPEKYNPQDRGKKIWYYYIQPGAQCDSTMLLEGSKIAVEFDALGRVNLVTEQNY